MIILIRAIFHENNKYYPQVFLDECVYKTKKLNVKKNLKKTGIQNRASNYFDDIIKDKDINFSGILLDEKLYEIISVYDISCKIAMGPNLMRIRFDKIDGFIRVRGDEFRYSVLFDCRLFDNIYDTIDKKSGITDSINHNFGKIRIDSYNPLPIEKILTFNNVIILIKSVVNKNKNEYCHNIFLEKGSYKDARYLIHESDTRYF